MNIKKEPKIDEMNEKIGVLIENIIMKHDMINLLNLQHYHNL